MSTRSGGRYTLTAERLRELLEYKLETGEFFWRIRRGTAKAGDSAGCLDLNGYLQIQIDGVNHHGHRLAWLYETGEWPKFDVDHINGITSDTRFQNLRDVPHAINGQNRRKAPSNSSHQFMGVSRSGNRWRAYISVNRRQVHLGCFATPEEAEQAHLAAKRMTQPGCTI